MFCSIGVPAAAVCHMTMNTQLITSHANMEVITKLL
jgi:hypothetical protein